MPACCIMLYYDVGLKAALLVIVTSIVYNSSQTVLDIEDNTVIKMIILVAQ